MPRCKDTPTFITKAKEKWGDKFGYDRCGVWCGAKVKFEFYCRKCEEYFLQTPDKHLQGTGCKKCHYEAVGLSQPKRRNIDKFIEDARNIHGDKYDYSRVKNPMSQNLLEIRCPLHGWFEQRCLVHLRGSGCGGCAIERTKKKQTMTTEECLVRFREVHGNKYEYPNFETKGCFNKIVIVCPIHGEWDTTTMSSHLCGRACPRCSKLQMAASQTSCTEEFVTKAQLLPGYKEKYDYTDVAYINAKSKVTIRCIPHNYTFEQTPNKHIRGDEGCHKCQTNGCSKKQLKWLEYIEKTTEGGYIQHKLNGGEFRIPGTRYHADGWRPEINTIYEFNGDLWHGRPSHPDYIQDEFHPVIKDKTWGEVYEGTLKKEQKIRELGYILVVMWESEWDCHAHKPKDP